MANVWTGDPNIISVWNFESGALTTDSKGTNTLTAVNTPAEDLVDYKQGTCCTSLAYASKRFFKIADASLSAGFPLKSGDAVQRISMGCWFRAASYSGSSAPAIIGKGAYGGAGINLYLTATTGLMQISWNGTGIAFSPAPGAPTVGVWYHIAVCIDGRARTCWARIYNSNTNIASTHICAAQAADLTLTAEWRIGAFSGTDADRTFDGKIDEAFVFNRLLSEREIDAIRNGSYEYAPPSVVSANDYTRDLSCKSVYHFESGALTTDSKGSVNLTASATAPVVNTVDYKVGSGCAEFNYRDNSYYLVTDANIPATWPMKSGFKHHDWTVCCWVKGFDHGSTARSIWSKFLSTGSAYSANLQVSSTSRTFKIALGYGTTNNTTLDTLIAFLPNEWYHISVSVSLGTIPYGSTCIVRIYRATTGTVEVFQSVSLGTGLEGAADFRVGTNHSAPTENWNGLIDELVVFRRSLTIEECDAIRSGTYKGPISPDTPGLFFTPATLTFAQAVNIPRLQFTHGGDANWSIENNETRDGSFAVKSGTIGLNQESWFSTTVQGPGVLIFWWAVDSTADHHYLQFQIDGVEQHKISGPNNPGAWAKKTYSITSGLHTLKWRYFTDGNAVDNRNAGWVDEISFGYANDFTDDSNCKALYKFENCVDIGYDSIGSTHLHNQNCVLSNAIRFKEGFQSAEFFRDRLHYLSAVDGELPAGFPLKNSDTTRTGTWCFWVYFKNLAGSAYYDIISKGSTTNRALNLYYYNGLNANWGYSGGNQVVAITGTTGWAANRWYHISLAFDGVNKRLYCRVWSDSAQQIICDQASAITNAMVASADNFTLGAHSGSVSYFDGILDEVVIFNRQLPSWQMDAIRKGLFSGTGPTQPGNDFTGDSNCKALWKFEAGALTTDTISTNTLTDHSTVSITNVADAVKEGSGCVKTTNAVATWLHVADGSLAAGFPLKNGDANKVISVCLWFRPLDVGSYRTIISKYNSTTGSFFIQFNSSGNMFFRYAFGSGTLTYQDFQIGTGLVANTWYHLGFTIDGINKKLTYRLYNSSIEVATYGEMYPGAELRVDATDWAIGANQGASTGTAANPFYGYIDEVVVFNRLLNILEIDSIRQGTYSGTGKTGIAVDHVSAQIAFRTTDRQTYFCVDADTGDDLANDGLSYQRPWHSHKARFFAPGDTITFPPVTKYVQIGTATLVNGSMTVATTLPLAGTLGKDNVVSFGSDNVPYSINSILGTAITLYRPYRGSNASSVAIYKWLGVYLSEWSNWNTGLYSGYANQHIKMLGGVNRTTGSQDSWSFFDFRDDHGFEDVQPFIDYKRFAISDTFSVYGFNVANRGSVYEDIFLGKFATSSFTDCYQSTFARIICEGGTIVTFNGMVDCTVDDFEAFSGDVAGIALQDLKNITFNRFKTGNCTSALSLAGGALRDVIFYNPVFDEGIAHTQMFLCNGNNQCFIEGVTFINISCNDSTPKFAYYHTTDIVVGDVAFEHYNGVKDSNRTYLFNGLSIANYTAIMYRDASTFRTIAPSTRIDLTNGSESPVIRKFLVPGPAGLAVTISCYVRFNSSYLKNIYTLPKMTVRTISGTIPNYVWVDTIVTSGATVDTWHLLTQTVTPSIDSILEVFLSFQAASPSAQVWFDDFDVSVAE
jgi:hypothetical protein